MDNDPTWRLHLEVTPTMDGRFVRSDSELEFPEQTQRVRSGRAHSIDLLYEHLQEQCNNALRQLCNDLQRKLKNKGVSQR